MLSEIVFVFSITFECFFIMPVPENRDIPKFKSQPARAAANDGRNDCV
jgi:hypothetical protein